MTVFAFTNITAPEGCTVVATLTAPDGSTVVATLTLAAGSPATVYAGNTTLSPTPADAVTTPYTFGITATDGSGTRNVYAPGSIYGWLVSGVWYPSQIAAEEAAGLLPPPPGPDVSPLEKWSVITPPVDTPVEYSDAKLHLRLDNDDEQSLVEMFICAATDYAQDNLAKSLMPQTLRYVANAEDVELTPPVMDYPWDPLSPLGTPLGTPSFATWGTYNRSPCVRLPRGPVSGINSVVDGAGNPIENFALERTPAGDRLRFMATSLYPVIITYSAGYASQGAIPAGIRVAIMAHVGTLYRNRESATAGSMTVVPHSLEAFYKLKSRRIVGG